MVSKSPPEQSSKDRPATSRLIKGRRVPAAGGSQPPEGKGDHAEVASGKPWEKREGAPARKWDKDKPPRREGRADKPFKKPWEKREGAPARKWDKGKPPRREGGADKPFKKPWEKREGAPARKWDKDKPPRREGGADKPFKKPWEKREGAPARKWDKDKPPRREGGAEKPFKKPWEKREGAPARKWDKDKPPRREGGAEKPFKKPWEKREGAPARKWDKDKPPRREGGAEKPFKKPWEKREGAPARKWDKDKPPRREGGAEKPFKKPWEKREGAPARKWDKDKAPPRQGDSDKSPRPQKTISETVDHHARNLRGKAALILEEILDKRQSLKRVLQREQERIEREDDRALLREIVTGVIRNLPSIDRALASAVKRGLEETQSELLHILRVGVFQILFLDKVPLYAAVDQCVEAAKPLNPGAGGFVNGILRAISDRKAHWLVLPEGGDPSSVSLRTGMPEWLVRRYLTRFGAVEGMSILEAFQRPAATALVFPSEEALKEAEPGLTAEGWPLHPDPALPLTFTVAKGNPAFSDAFQKGLFYIMDPASQAPAALLPLKGNEAVLDLCAAPGGKTILMAKRLDDGGWVLSTDVNRRRLGHLRENIERLRLENVRMAQVDVEAPLPFYGSFDAVVLDAPCSSLGTLRRNPEIRWQLKEDDLRFRTTKQVALLEQAAAAVRPGGILSYSVCSIEEEETTHVIKDFLERQKEFSPLEIAPPGPWKPLLEKVGPGQVCLLPHRHPWDAFFVALLKRKGPQRVRKVLKGSKP